MAFISVCIYFIQLRNHTLCCFYGNIKCLYFVCSVCLLARYICGLVLKSLMNIPSSIPKHQTVCFCIYDHTYNKDHNCTVFPESVSVLYRVCMYNCFIVFAFRCAFAVFERIAFNFYLMTEKCFNCIYRAYIHKSAIFLLMEMLFALNWTRENEKN